MKNLNILLDNLEKKYPFVTQKLDSYGSGTLVQIIVASKKDKTIPRKENTESGIYVNNNTEKNCTIIEILYGNIQEKKKYEKELYNILVNILADNIIYVSFFYRDKDILRIQLYKMEELKKLEI